MLNVYISFIFLKRIKFNLNQTKLQLVITVPTTLWLILILKYTLKECNLQNTYIFLYITKYKTNWFVFPWRVTYIILLQIIENINTVPSNCSDRISATGFRPLCRPSYHYLGSSTSLLLYCFCQDYALLLR